MLTPCAKTAHTVCAMQVSVARWLNAVPLLRPVSGLMSRLYVQLVGYCRSTEHS